MFLWGSILAWFAVLPITSSPGFYVAGIGVFEFDFLGVFYEVFWTATFWFYWPLASIVALGPTIVFRTLRLDLSPTLIDDVRLKMKKDGRKSFRRELFKKKLPRISFSLADVKQRTGYAFSHQGGFGKLLLSGRMFGGQSEEQVYRERENRISKIIRSAPCSPVPQHRGLGAEPTPMEPSETILEVHESDPQIILEPTTTLKLNETVPDTKFPDSIKMEEISDGEGDGAPEPSSTPM